MKRKHKVLAWNIIALILYFMAIAWNIKSGGNYNLEIAIGGLILGAFQAWQTYLS